MSSQVVTPLWLARPHPRWRWERRPGDQPRRPRAPCRSALAAAVAASSTASPTKLLFLQHVAVDVVVEGAIVEAPAVELRRRSVPRLRLRRRQQRLAAQREAMRPRQQRTLAISAVALARFPRTRTAWLGA